MTISDILFAAGLLCWAGLAVFLARAAWACFAIFQPAQRSHMDPLPGGLRAIWPMVDMLQFHVARTAPTAWLLRTRLQLLRAGRQFFLTEQELIALQFCGGILAAALTWLLCGVAGVENRMLWSPLLGALGFGYPHLWLREKRARRLRSMERSLPACLDLLVLCCQGGLTLTGALIQAVDKGEESPLRAEIELVLRDIRAGTGRAAALQAMAWRIDMPALHHLVASLVQAEALGASTTETLEAISEQSRNDRFQRAEKQAMEAPVKMIGPLVIFIFPVTFIIIFAPLVLEFLRNGRRF